MMGPRTHGYERPYLKHRLGSRYLLWFSQVAVARKYMFFLLCHRWGWSQCARTYNMLLFSLSVHRRKPSFFPDHFSLSCLFEGEIIEVLGNSISFSSVSISQGAARKAGLEYGVTHHVSALIYSVITVTNFCFLKHKGLKWSPWRRKKVSVRILTNSSLGNAALPLHWIKSDQHGQRGPVRGKVSRLKWNWKH